MKSISLFLCHRAISGAITLIVKDDYVNIVGFGI